MAPGAGWDVSPVMPSRALGCNLRLLGQRRSPADAAQGELSCPFAVQRRHLMFGIALSSCRTFGRCGLDGGDIAGRKSKVECTERFRQTIPAAGTDQRHDVVPLCQHPSDRDLRDAGTARFRYLAQRVDQPEVAIEIVALETRAMAAEVGSDRGSGPVPVAADQAARQHAVGGYADAKLAARVENAVLDATRQQRVLDLQVAIGCTAAARRMVSEPTSDKPICLT